MNAVSISQLKINPASVISDSHDEPVAVKKRDKVQAYIIGSELFENIISLLEDANDLSAAKKTDFSKGQNLEDVAAELGL